MIRFIKKVLNKFKKQDYSWIDKFIVDSNCMPKCDLE